MTREEKKDIYTLLKKSSDWICGFKTDDFISPLSFEDDLELAEETSVQADSQTELPSVQEKLTALYAKINNCQNCILHRQRTNTVPGEGCPAPYVMVIGEGPGEDEDKSGRPFVGKAGQLLDKMLSAIQLDRRCNCYIANIVKCRPPANRDPMPDECDSCSGYLQTQIHILKPKMILALGRTAAQNLLKTEQGINALRGKFFDYNGIPLLATYHPSALLRNESLKRPAWEDLKTFRSKLNEICPGYDESFKNLG